MSTLLSWHKPGQKVAVLDGKEHWPVIGGVVPPQQTEKPVVGRVYTISDVAIRLGLVFFGLEELDPWDRFAAHWFRPVYPTIIDQLRQVDAPVSDREVEPV